MSVYSGRQGRGAARLHRARKRAEAAERDERTLPERRSTKTSPPVSTRGSARAGDQNQH